MRACKINTCRVAASLWLNFVLQSSNTMLTLYSDRHSPFVRAILLFLRANNVEFVEKKVALFKGEHLKLDELPTKKLPTLIVDGGDDPVTLSQSTTILRYLATYHAEDGSWYTDPKIRFKIDEFFDYLQVRSINVTFCLHLQHWITEDTLFQLNYYSNGDLIWFVS